MLSICTPGQLPYVVAQPFGTYLYEQTAAASPGGACHNFMTFYGSGVTQPTEITEFMCRWQSSDEPPQTGSYAIVKTCDSYPDMTGYDFTAGAGLWGFSLVGILLCYFAAHGIGLVLKAVRDG